MRISIELESFAVKAFVVLPFAIWCVLKGQPDLIAAVAALIAALKP